MRKNEGITLIALIITIIILLILAGVTITFMLGDNGLLNRAKDVGEVTKKETIEEKIKLMLSDYMIENATGTKTLEEYLNEQKAKGEIEEVRNNNDGTITVEIQGYEVTIQESDLSIISIEKVGGVRPNFEIKITKTDGTELTSGETEKALTVNITNIAEYGDNYTIEVKDKEGNNIEKEANIVGSVTGQASFIIRKSGNYTITVKGTKEGIIRITEKIEQIKLEMPTITTQFSKAIGVIDIVWLDMDNNVISSPISPKEYLGGLIPIKYEANNWVTADENNTQNDWYQYIAQIGVTDTKTSNWANAKTSNNKAYFVWIPRYAYKIIYFDTQANANAYRNNSLSTTGIIGYSTIEGMVAEENKTLKLVEGTEPTNVTGVVKTESYAEYIPHPAFEFGGRKAGIWVGKFESSGSKSTVAITPNANSLREISVSDIFTACQGVKTTYGLTGDTHMMKNTEWGAVAYLAESKYGRNGTQVTINNSNYTTGGGNYVSNILQSTTGNIYGIYDMNGTSTEYVAGYLNNSSVSSNGYNTNLVNAVAKNSKYADVYKVAINDTDRNNYVANKGVKGDAVYETSNSWEGSNSWHDDFSSFPCNVSVIFRRGFTYTNGGNAGTFSFGAWYGNSYDPSFRVVCVP